MNAVCSRGRLEFGVSAGQPALEAQLEAAAAEAASRVQTAQQSTIRIYPMRNFCGSYSDGRPHTYAHIASEGRGEPTSLSAANRVAWVESQPVAAGVR